MVTADRSIQVARKKESIAVKCQQAVGVFIPKEYNFTSMNQFRSITLSNMVWKISLSPITKRLTYFLKDNS